MQLDNKKVLFLYSEVAAYFLACAEKLHINHGCEVHIVRWPINPEAPFAFRDYQGITFYERSDLLVSDILDLYRQIKPDLVYVSGWMDKVYLKAAKTIRKSGTPVICGSDNHWRGDLRQHVASIFARSFLHSRFSHFMIPGLPQYPFALRLGFKPQQIITGLYSAEIDPFLEAHARFRTKKEQNYPHNFLYVGRFVDIKGIAELSQAFTELNEEMRANWTLTLTGTGPLKEKMNTNKNIIIKDFVQPEQLPDLAKDAGCFILPSRQEPWGVALHEFAAAGLPLIASHRCGSATAFLRNGYNGFQHLAGSKESIKQALKKIIETSDHQLLIMGERSSQLSQQYTPQSWAASLFELIK